MAELNNSAEKTIANKIIKISHSPIEILKNGELYITIRGWGNLTGIGGYNLSEEQASKIQDDFRDWIIYKISKK